MRVWDMESGCCGKVLRGHEDVVEDVAVTKDGKRVLSEACNNKID